MVGEVVLMVEFCTVCEGVKEGRVRIYFSQCVGGEM